MLLPRFSIRTMLWIAAGVAVVSIFAGQAAGGRIWAMGITIGLLSVVFALLVQAAFFSLGSMAARYLGPQEIVARTSRGGVERSSVARLDTSSTPEPTAAQP